MTGVAALGALAALCVLGSLALVAGGWWPDDGVGRFVAGAVAGAVVLGLTGTTIVVLDLRLQLLAVYAVGGLLAAAAWRRFKHGRPPANERAASGAVETTVSRLWWNAARVAAPLLLSAAALLLAWILVVSTRDRLWWDGWAIWGFKARALFLAKAFPAAFTDPSGPYGYSHLDYPLGVPLVGWWVYAHAGQADPALLSMTGAVWFALLVASVWGFLRRRVAPWLSALAAVGTAAFWPIAYYAIGGTADVVVAIALVGAVAEIELGLLAERTDGLWRAGIFLALGAMAKNEGLALGVVMLGVVGWSLRRQPGRARRLVALGTPLLTCAPWLLFRLIRGLSTDALARPSLQAIMERAPVLLRGLWIQLTLLPWVPILLLALLGIAALGSRGWPGLRTAWGIAGAYLGTLCLVYLISPDDITWLIVTSLPRVLGPLVPATLVLSVLGAWSTPASGSAPLAGALDRPGYTVSPADSSSSRASTERSTGD